MERKEKQPSEIYDYYIDGSDYFDEIEDTDEIDDIVITKDVTTSPDLEIGPSTFPEYVLVGDNPIDFKVWVGGGLDGTTYVITCLITTLVGRKEEYEFKLKVKEKT
jgi:hypothetical protein